MMLLILNFFQHCIWQLWWRAEEDWIKTSHAREMDRIRQLELQQKAALIKKLKHDVVEYWCMRETVKKNGGKRFNECVNMSSFSVSYREGSEIVMAWSHLVLVPACLCSCLHPSLPHQTNQLVTTSLLHIMSFLIGWTSSPYKTGIYTNAWLSINHWIPVLDWQPLHPCPSRRTTLF